ncbi:dienelactone hydrolase family protein [Pseudomaricurvus alkylphenolicus]|uniref:dienelactone hydrolase family protein n=1 Tax=Pseudomaricurvus alkylphenolicus TaxID=1306991 RepID=UPI001981FC1B|nr:dienelactone hydrolase family protein [Pseudomaricurvus alkylphenolicus]
MPMIQLTAADGFTLDAYQVLPQGTPKGAVVVIQEIFGVNGHIRQVTDSYAAAGYVAIAPALFDRQEKDVQLGYDQEAHWNKGMQLAFEGYDRDAGMKDIQAAVDAVAQYGKVAIVGYCFGGLLAWLAANQVTGLSAVSSYYGGFIGQEAHRKPQCPVILHFGKKDLHIPESEINMVREANPEVTIHMYDADHGFNCDHRESYHAESSALAKEHTLAFFNAQLS